MRISSAGSKQGRRDLRGLQSEPLPFGAPRPDAHRHDLDRHGPIPSQTRSGPGEPSSTRKIDPMFRVRVSPAGLDLDHQQEILGGGFGDHIDFDPRDPTVAGDDPQSRSLEHPNCDLLAPATQGMGIQPIGSPPGPLPPTLQDP